MRNLILPFVCLLIFFSCKKENINIPDTGRKLVINSLFTTETLLSIFINKSRYINDTLEYYDIDSINNAKVYIYQDNILLDSLIYIKQVDYAYDFYHTGLYYNYKSNYLFPKSGKEYEVIVKAPGFPDAESKTVIPQGVKIEKIDTITVMADDYYFDTEINGDNIYKKSFICNIKFTDPADVKDYYLLNVCRFSFPNWMQPYKLNLPFVCNDPIIDETLESWPEYSVAFTDKTINGKTHILTLRINAWLIGWPFYEKPQPQKELIKNVIYFRLYSISKEYYDYIKTLNQFMKNNKNPLSEPIHVYSNIDGGYGIFAGAAVYCDSIVFK